MTGPAMFAIILAMQARRQDLHKISLLLLTTLLIGATSRPAEWAQPIYREGVPNLFKVTDQVYRSAQPTAAGMNSLEAIGIRTVINLRAFHSDRDEIAGTTLLNGELSVKTWHIEDEDVVRVLAS